MLEAFPTRRPSRAIVVTSLFVAFAAASCGVLPNRFYPPFRDHDLLAQFVVPATGRISIPATTKYLVVHELALDPEPLGESFDADGTRWLLYDRGTSVLLRGKFRVYSDSDGVIASPEQLLPGAALVQVLEVAR